jgi:hypothetical protein
MSGYVYLIQTPELQKVNCFKIGLSCVETNARLASYGKDVDVIQVHKCGNPREIESLLKTRFNVQFKLHKGCEYFIGNRDKIEACFIDCCSDIQIKPITVSINKFTLIDQLQSTITKDTKFADIVVKCHMSIPELIDHSPKILQRLTFWLCQPKLSIQIVAADIELARFGILAPRVRCGVVDNFVRKDKLDKLIWNSKSVFRIINEDRVCLINKANSISKWCENPIDTAPIPLLNDISPVINEHLPNQRRDCYYISVMGLLQIIVTHTLSKCSDVLLKTYGSLMLDLLAMYHDTINEIKHD